MKFTVVFIMSIIFAASAFGQSACLDIFGQKIVEVVQPPVEEPVKPKKQRISALDRVTQEQLKQAATELVQQMSSLENKIEWWSNLTGQYERTSLFELRNRRKKFEFYFETSGELYEAVNIYRETFKTVEFSYLKLKRYYDTPIKQRDAIYSKEELAKIETTFGETYGDYMYVRRYLEDILAKMPTDATSPEGILYANAKYVLGRLGVPVISERYEGLNVTRERPTILEIENIFRSNPGPLIAKLKRDLVEERKLALRTFVTGALQVQALQQIIYKILPAKLKEAVTNFLGINYNSYVLKRFLSDIELVVNAKTPENQLIVFREMAAKHNSTDFFTTFARLVSYSDVWVSLRKSVSDRKDQAVYKRLLEEMDKGEAALANLSFLPQFHKPSLIDHFTKWILPGGIAGATYLYGDFLQIKQTVMEVYQYVAGSLPF